MSNPDLLLTIQAYSYMLMMFNKRLSQLNHIPEDIDHVKQERNLLITKVTRVEQLSNALIEEYDKRENV